MILSLKDADQLSLVPLLPSLGLLHWLGGWNIRGQDMVTMPMKQKRERERVISYISDLRRQS